MRSIQSRLSLGLFLSLFVLFSVQWLLVSHAVRLLAENYISERLMHDAESLLRTMSVDAQGKLILDHASVNPVFLRPFSGHYYRITTDDQTLRSRSLWDQDLSIPPTPNKDVLVTFIPGPQDKTLFLWAKPFIKQGKSILIAVGEDFSPVESDLQRFQMGYALTSLFALALLIGMQVLMVRKGFTPLNRTRQELARLEQGEIETLNDNVPSEIFPLVNELNRLLESLRQRLQRSRKSLGNLTHAMKTPLTHLQQVAHSDALDKLPEVRERLLNQTTQLQQLMERELTRARLAGHSIPGQRLDPAQELKALKESLLTIHRDKPLDIQYQLDMEQTINMDREDFLELMGNLLDNACKWATQTIKVSIREENGLQIQVEDDGPGCAEEELATLTQRGRRLDETTAGHGLGLAIVQDIIDSYHGSIHFGRSPELGGLQVTLRLSL
jgi:signal transduction histidine kinase